MVALAVPLTAAAEAATGMTAGRLMDGCRGRRTSGLNFSSAQLRARPIDVINAATSNHCR